MTLFPLDDPNQNAQRAGKTRGARLGIVVDNKDCADNPGFRVKVKFPWLSEQEATFWARISVPFAGNDRGTYVLPEIGDQLLCVFEHGDINRPIVIGSLWSKQQMPPEDNSSGKNNTKLIKSRSGHRVIFDDADGAEKITIVDKTKNNKIVLDAANKLVTIESDGDIQVTAKQNVIVHGQAVKITTSQTLGGKGQSVLCHAAQAFGLKASSGITVNGSQVTVNVTGSAACQVSGSGAGQIGAIGSETVGDQVAEQKT